MQPHFNASHESVIYFLRPWNLFNIHYYLMYSNIESMVAMFFFRVRLIANDFYCNFRKSVVDDLY